MVPVVSCVVSVAKDILGSGDVVLVLESDMVVTFELVARPALPPKPEADEYEMLDRAEVMSESSEMVDAPVLSALLELVAVVVVILYAADQFNLFKSNFAGALRLSCVDSTQMEDEVEDMATFVAIGIATATVECRTLHPGDRPVPILVEVSSVTVIRFQDNRKTE